MKTWNERLGEALADEGMKPNQLAKQLELSAPTISAWLGKGTIRRADNLSGENLLRVCKVLKIRPEWLIFEEGSMRANAANVGTELEWPFHFTPAQFARLTDAQRGRIEGYAQALIDQLEEIQGNRAAGRR